MNYVLEAILVGLYSIFIYLLFSRFINNLYILLLLVGFCKHYFAYYLQIHTLYCNNGDACQNTLHNDNYTTSRSSYIAKSIHLLRDSIIESFCYLILGVLLSNILTNRNYLFFFIGFLFHIGAELLGIHNYFCRESCKKQPN